jgi:acetyl-CoA carboxylase carboxyl transferase subunit alpha
MVDTSGAYPGVGAEERGVAEAIARNLREMSVLAVPIVVVVTGEGGSGGALALAVGNRVMALENSVYSVISPEGCASILWRDGSRAEQAAATLKITSSDLLGFKLIDEIIPEPLGGAHSDWDGAANNLKQVILRSITELGKLTGEELINQRVQKFRGMGVYATQG